MDVRCMAEPCDRIAVRCGWSTEESQIWREAEPDERQGDRPRAKRSTWCDRL